MSTEVNHERFMARALQLAKRGLYTTDPNPRVGCVVVKDGQIVAEGWHQTAGAGHAEVEALKAAGESAKGATVYVTLEPCSHTGKTPPCADQLIRAGIVEVVCAMQDPNPLVSGRGFERLRQAGIPVVNAVLEQQARELNPGFIKRMELGLPLVRCKLAMSLDGRTAMASGESQWITGPAARSDVQRLRARSSAIITGVGTAVLDNPSLNLRSDELGLENALEVVQRQPLRVLLDSRFRIPATAKLLDQTQDVLVIGAEHNASGGLLAEQGIETLVLANEQGQVDLKAVLKELAQRECNEVLLEAGATLSGAFLQLGLVDELVLYVAPKLLGGDARSLFNLPGLQSMSDQIKIEIKDVRNVGEDLRINAIVAATS
ncbi:MAG: bifunctional diaminohydroxyphosphoribosylaminopyrimidine deaminase/5-amino-6-(5-phosphoribosylamino)uracil reductase RibD [Pseudomonadales bacterium]|nr:bifunctional diaminohydroxyphosphoribosylaminopyrimidine deaminase/5-amino-6-(5-phosphoribosylamino)uracil reductase RibD [Pseudomonadales bacterium]MCP5213728.1 bifunctional diaminohydroxyphosphoribosylaminopyrimidine deaminase/5-amino-6-(5-phosphoribosylamino)uracil reductase RibD [Pseudomonadales bacterium]